MKNTVAERSSWWTRVIVVGATICAAGVSNSGLSTLNEDQIAERGARIARRDDRACREHVSEEQRSEPGCPAREVVLDQRGQATSSRDADRQSSGTIWSGVYSADQARRAEPLAARSCAKCHGPDLTGGQDGPGLVGPEVLEAWSTLTIGDLFDRIRMTMPADAPLSLSPQETVDLLAYVLSLNKCPPGEKELPADKSVLDQIRVTSRREGE